MHLIYFIYCTKYIYKQTDFKKYLYTYKLTFFFILEEMLH